MSGFEVKPDGLAKQVGMFAESADSLKHIAGEVKNIRVGLGFSPEVRKAVGQALDKLSQAVLKDSSGCEGLSKSLSQVVKAYEDHERDICGKSRSKISQYRASGVDWIKNAWPILGSVLGVLGAIPTVIGEIFSVNKGGSAVEWISSSGQTIKDYLTKVFGDKQPEDSMLPADSSSASNQATDGSSVSVQPADIQPKEGRLLSESTGSSKGNADQAGLTYYTQGRNIKEDKNGKPYENIYNAYWNYDQWKGADGTDYREKSSVACGICCDAMIASHFGLQVTPGELIQENQKKDVNHYANASWNHAGVTEVMKEHGLTPKKLASLGSSYKMKQDALQECLEKYRKDPKHNAPPMVGIYNYGEGSNHYVLVAGQDENGDYIIIDPAEDKRTILKTKESGYGGGINGGYQSVIKEIIVWEKTN